MTDHPGSYIDELVPERSKRPVFHWLEQCKPPEKITKWFDGPGLYLLMFQIRDY